MGRSWLRARALAVWLPIYPAPPVTRTFIGFSRSEVLSCDRRFAAEIEVAPSAGWVRYFVVELFVGCNHCGYVEIFPSPEGSGSAHRPSQVTIFEQGHHRLRKLLNMARLHNKTFFAVLQ